MRIIAGKWRGQRLDAPQGKQTRPILDQVKEALFNILGARLAMPGTLPPCQVLDLFAGTGSLGLEALSRGAARCTFVEQHGATASILRHNVARLNAQSQSDVVVSNAWKLDLEEIPTPDPFEVVFVDPPYRDAQSLQPRSTIQALLSRIADSDNTDGNAVIVLRHPSSTASEPVEIAGCSVLDQRVYGGMTLTLLTPQ